MHLTYYLQKDDQSYEAFYTYKEGAMDANEVYARQLCEYFIVNGSQYRLLSNEMDGNEEMLIIEHLGAAAALPGEIFYKKMKAFILSFVNIFLLLICLFCIHYRSIRTDGDIGK
ncbi:hypothetical protein GCM10020331_042930 [Ectobacillus funiculus]